MKSKTQVPEKTPSTSPGPCPSPGRRLSLPSEEQDPGCDYAIKTILLGDMGVGKTTLFQTLLCGKGSCRVRFTCGHMIVPHEGKKAKVILTDTGGQEKYRSLTTSYYRGAHACLLLYDVNRQETLDNITTWLESMKEFQASSQDIITVLVGTTREDKWPADDQEPVDSAKAQKLAAHHELPHFENIDCSNDLKSLDFVMETLVAMVIKRAKDNSKFSQSIQPSGPTVLQDDKRQWWRRSCCCA